MTKNASKGTRNGANRVKGVVADEAKTASADDAAKTDDAPKTDDAKTTETDDDEKETGPAAVAKKAIKKAREPLHALLQEKVVTTFEHGTLAGHAHTHGRTEVSEAKKGKVKNYNIDAIVRRAPVISISAARVRPNLFTRTDDLARQASFMGDSFYGDAALMLVYQDFNVFRAMVEAAAEHKRQYGHADETVVTDNVKDWVSDWIKDLHDAEPRGNRNTARGGTQPTLVMVSMIHGQPWNLQPVFERPAVDSEEAASRIAKGHVDASKRGGADERNELLRRGWDGKDRTAVLCSSSQASDHMKGAGLGEKVLVADLTELTRTVKAWIDETGKLHDKLPRFLNLHMIKYAPPGNYNRTPTGHPKMTSSGDVARILWSSAAMGAACREVAAGRGRGTPYVISTTMIVSEIVRRLGQDSPEAHEIVGGFVSFVWGEVNAIADPIKCRDNWRTKSGYMPGTDELDRAADKLRVFWRELMTTAGETVSGVNAAYAAFDAASKN